MQYDFGEPIAVRQLTIEGATPGTEEVFVRLGRPRPFPDPPDWYCPFEIEGCGERISHYAAGVDAMQALQLATSMIGIDLANLNRRLGGKLRWLDMTDLGLHPPSE